MAFRSVANDAHFNLTQSDLQDNTTSSTIQSLYVADALKCPVRNALSLRKARRQLDKGKCPRYIDDVAYDPGADANTFPNSPLCHGRLLESRLQPVLCCLNPVLQRTFQTGRGIVILGNFQGTIYRFGLGVVKSGAKKTGTAKVLQRGPFFA